MRSANLALRLVLEIAGILSVAYWGYQQSDGIERWVIAIGAAFLLIVVWGLVIAPRARVPIRPAVRELLGSGLLLLAAVALSAAGQTTAASAFAVLNLVNTILLFALRR